MIESLSFGKSFLALSPIPLFVGQVRKNEEEKEKGAQMCRAMGIFVVLLLGLTTLKADPVVLTGGL